MSICFINVSNSGTYQYTLRLVKKLAKHISIYIITNKAPEGGHRSAESMVYEVWKRNSLRTPYDIGIITQKLGCRIVVIQYEYSIFGHPLLSQILLILVMKALKRIGAKVVLTLHGVLHPDTFTKNTLLRKMLWKVFSIFYEFLVSYANIIVVLNPLQKKVLEEYGINTGKFVVIPHGAEKCRVYKVKDEKRASDSFVILFHGFLRPSKGLLELIEAVKILNAQGVHVKVKILGSIPYQFFERSEERRYVEEVLKMCKELKDMCLAKVGFHTIEELFKEAANSDVIVLPYTDRFIESSGVLHLFMDCGKPVIVSRTPRFLSDVIDGVEVLSCDTKPEELAKTILQLIMDRELQRFLSRNLKQKAQSRYWEIIAHKWLEILNKAGDV